MTKSIENSLVAETPIDSDSSFTPPRPARRPLRGYAFDPSLATELATALVSEITYKVRWEENLASGPSGEYVEVVDYDPASGCFYAPVDLNHARILAQNGLAPSEGNPQFHQQMVYAVVMTTIERFERALGRKALWADRYKSERPDEKIPIDEQYVQKLRIYPHALRMANAYYSRKKMALLFGYFPGTTDPSSGLLPGGIVFSCLSHDIVAHETTHALLDGFHEYLMEATNPDALAFHEAFADIVALFQHFTFPEVLAHQIATTRGDIGGSENLLGQLATQFGHARGSHGALRDAIGKFDPEQRKWVRHEPDPTEIENTMEVHARGAVLVAAVFDAFLAVYARRTGDLIRLASNGTGELVPGAIHPDLVARLAGEAAKVAGRILDMCIRALDYCPPVDLTFGEYLRAIITADMDLTPEEGREYRVAFIESFRRRGIYPRDLRTLSEDSLRWAKPEEDVWQKTGTRSELRIFLENSGLKESIAELRGIQDRYKIWKTTRDIRENFHGKIKGALEKAEILQRTTGLAFTDAMVPEGVRVRKRGDEPPSFSVQGLREARRLRDDGTMLNQVFITLIQTAFVGPEDDLIKIRFGCSLVIDLDRLHGGDGLSPVTYVIRKGLSDESRRNRVIQYTENRNTSLAATYFEASDEPFAALHNEGA